MSTAAKKMKNDSDFDSAFDAAMEQAMDAKPKDVKVHITCRLDSDVYMGLKDIAEKLKTQGIGNGKYQTLMNDFLRESIERFYVNAGSPEVGKTTWLQEVKPEQLIKHLWDYIKEHKIDEEPRSKKREKEERKPAHRPTQLMAKAKKPHHRKVANRK